MVNIILPSGKYFSFCPYDTMFHVNVFKLLARLKGPGGEKPHFIGVLAQLWHAAHPLQALN